MANVIVFKNLTPKIYNILPSSIKDIQDVMVILFIGLAKLTLEDFEHTPVLICQNPVFNALNWLCLNHSDYLLHACHWPPLHTHPNFNPKSSSSYYQTPWSPAAYHYPAPLVNSFIISFQYYIY